MKRWISALLFAIPQSEGKQESSEASPVSNPINNPSYMLLPRPWRVSRANKGGEAGTSSKIKSSNEFNCWQVHWREEAKRKIPQSGLRSYQQYRCASVKLCKHMSGGRVITFGFIGLREPWGPREAYRKSNKGRVESLPEAPPVPLLFLPAQPPTEMKEIFPFRRVHISYSTDSLANKFHFNIFLPSSWSALLLRQFFCAFFVPFLLLLLLTAYEFSMRH